jgi:hypothetical protein
VAVLNWSLMECSQGKGFNHFRMTAFDAIALKNIWATLYFIKKVLSLQQFLSKNKQL